MLEDHVVAVNLDEPKDFGAFLAAKGGVEPDRIAPARMEPFGPNVERADRLRMIDDESFDPSRPTAFEEALLGEVDDEGMQWAARVGWQFARHINEGASFARIAEDTFLIPVRGAQPLHHDRHLADIPDEGGFSEHTWNLVVSGSETQMLLSEVKDGVYEHFPMNQGVLVYMNTVNRHALSRRDPTDLCVILQVCGYGPEERDAAVARMAAVVAARPKAVRL